MKKNAYIVMAVAFTAAVNAEEALVENPATGDLAQEEEVQNATRSLMSENGGFDPFYYPPHDFGFGLDLDFGNGAGIDDDFGLGGLGGLGGLDGFGGLDDPWGVPILPPHPPRPQPCHPNTAKRCSPDGGKTVRRVAATRHPQTGQCVARCPACPNHRKRCGPYRGAGRYTYHRREGDMCRFGRCGTA